MKKSAKAYSTDDWEKWVKQEVKIINKESGGSKMKCLVLTAILGINSEGAMRECEDGCQFYTTKNVNETDPEKQLAAGAPHKEPFCLLTGLAWSVMGRLKGGL